MTTVTCDDADVPIDRLLMRLLLQRSYPLDQLPQGERLLEEVRDVMAQTRAMPPDSALGLLARLNEWDRRRVFDRVLDRAPSRERAFWLWRLGNTLAERGHYGLAVTAYSEGASTESPPITRAILMIKAGLAANDGSLGGADRWLVSGTMLLDHVAESPGVQRRDEPPEMRFARFMAEYTGARYHLFRDAYDKAQEHLDRATAALTEDCLGTARVQMPDSFTASAAQDIPDVLLLRIRIMRYRFQFLAEGGVDEIVKAIRRAGHSSHQLIMLGAPFEHHLAFQLAAASQLRRNGHDEGNHQADVACRTLSSLSLRQAVTSLAQIPHDVNHRRLGGVFCLAGEIELDRGKVDAAIEHFSAASAVWNDPYYPRGISRAARLHALALMRDGKHLVEASRRLTESIAHARGCRSIASEARAVACKIALHTNLHHAQRADEYRADLKRIEQAMSGYWPRPHRGLMALAEGHPRPRPMADEEDGESEHEQLERKQLEGALAKYELWGSNPRFMNSVRQAIKAAKSDVPVLITGETGTGKTKLAHLIHRESRRKSGPFACVELAELQEELIESELFGAEPGAYTGAVFRKAKEGLIETANLGTLFLDNIMNASAQVQSKLLRVLETKQLRRVGGTKNITVDFRLIAASNKDLRDEVNLGQFRGDLFSRINIFPIELPPLRERSLDIPDIGQRLLQRYLLSEMPDAIGVIQTLTTNAWDEVCGYSWPGNVRDLDSMMRQIVAQLTGEDPRRLVTKTGELSLEFVRQFMRFDDRATQPSRQAPDEVRVLHNKIPITARALTLFILEKNCKTKRDVARSLHAAYPAYGREYESILPLLRKSPFAEVLETLGRRSLHAAKLSN